MRLQLLPPICVAWGLVLGATGCGPAESIVVPRRGDGPGTSGDDFVPDEPTPRVQLTRFEVVQWEASDTTADPRVTLAWLSDGDRCALAVRSNQDEAHPPLLLAGAGTTRVTLPRATLETILAFQLTCFRDGASSDERTVVEGIWYPNRVVELVPAVVEVASAVTACIVPAQSGCAVQTPLAPEQVWGPTDDDGCSTTFASQSSPVVVRCEGEPPVSAELAIGPTILALELEPPARPTPGPVTASWRSVLTDDDCTLTRPDGTGVIGASNGTVTFVADATGTVTLQCGERIRSRPVVVGPDITAVDVDVVTHEGRVRLEWSAPGALDCDLQLTYADDVRTLRGVPPVGVRHLAFALDAPGDLNTDVTCRVGALSKNAVQDFSVPFIAEVTVQAAPTPGWQNVCFVASGIDDGACRVIIGADWYYPLPPVGCVEVQTPADASIGELSCDAPTGSVAVPVSVPGLSD